MSTIDVTALGAELEATADLTQRLAAIARALPGRLAFSTSLGLEDQAILAAIAALPPGLKARFDVFTLDTGRHFPETLETLEASERRYGVKIRVIAPDAADIEALVAHDGINGFRASIEARKACCDVRKVRPLNRALKGASGWITGLRRDQSAGRAEIAFVERDGGLGLLKLNPIADWSLAQLEDYIHTHDVPVNPLHARGFPSIGCQPCTRAIQPGEDIRAGRWWWENEVALDQDGKECGLHSPNRPKPETPKLKQPNPKPPASAKSSPTPKAKS